MPRPDGREVFDHLGLVAGMVAALRLADVLDRVMPHHPEPRLGTGGSAGTAMVLQGRGVVNQPLDRGPMCCHNNPTQRLMGPGLDADHRHDDTRGRAWARLSDSGVTALSRLMAATAAPRLGRAPVCAPRDRPSGPGEGRDRRAEEPDATVLPSTRGASRDQRPALQHVRRDLMVAHQAGLPLRMPPLSGQSRAGQPYGRSVTAPSQPLQTASGTTALVADRALSRAEHLQKLGETGRQGITRGPATGRAAPVILPQADPQALARLREGERAQRWMAPSAGVPQRWLSGSSDQRRPEAQRLGDHDGRRHSAAAAQAFQQRCSPAEARAVEARHALIPWAQGVRAPALHAGAIQSLPRHSRRGRPSPQTPPARVWSHRPGAFAASLAAHDALVAPQRGCIRAPNARAAPTCPAHALRAGDQGQPQAARGVRGLQ